MNNPVQRFTAAHLADFYRDLDDGAGEMQCRTNSGVWETAYHGPCLSSDPMHWRIYRKPVPREWWIPIGPASNGVAHDSESGAKAWAAAADEIVHVREVIE